MSRCSNYSSTRKKRCATSRTFFATGPDPIYLIIMAFVYKSGRKEANAGFDVGPGTYELAPKSPPKPSAAPFGSSAPKQKSMSVDHIKPRPGPGSYELSSTKVKESTIPINKVEEIRLVEAPKESSNFKSGTLRFRQHGHDSPGPGAYNLNPEQPRGNPQARLASETNRLINTIIAMNRYKSIPSIPGSKQVFGYDEEGNMLQLNRNPFIEYTGTRNDSVGPGRYEIAMQSMRKGTSLWGRSRASKID
jgi:hypothetical protein